MSGDDQAMESWQVLEWGQPLQKVLGRVPTPTGTEVLVKVDACGVCHSDLHLREGTYDLGHGKAIALGKIGIHLPLTLGHEIVGTVLANGPDNGPDNGPAADATVGAQRVVFPWIGCGTCRHCARQREVDCETPISLGTRRPGGYASHVLVPHPRYVLPFEGIDPLVAASAACSGITAYSALKKVQATSTADANDTLVIVGAGGLGLAALGLVRHLTPARVVLVDSSAAKLDAARHLADAKVQITDANSGQQLRELAQGGAHAVIDFVGLPQTVEWSMAALRKGGTLIVVGLFGGGVNLSIPLLPMRNLTLRGSYVGSLAEFHELLALLRQPGVGHVPVQTAPMARINGLFDDIQQGRVHGRVLATP
jgi:D-arabinose 1-dehydrogenase-like Zn-dependent alcohol dehydrogenase